MVIEHSEINKINKSLKNDISSAKKQVSLTLDNENYYSDEDVDSRLALRQEYRKLIKITDEKKQDYIKTGGNGLINTIKMADKLFEKVKRPQEAALDSQLLVQTASIVNMKAKRLKLGNLLFDMDIYIGKLFSFIKDSKDCHMNEDSGLDWMKIGRLAMLCNKRPPTINFMLGPLSVERKERKVTRQERFHKNKEDLVQPEEIKDEDTLPQDNTTPKNVMNINNFLKRYSPIGLFEFVINPESFCQTVENMFYLSFLIREGKASLMKGKNDILVLESKNISSSEEQAQGNKKQVVIYIDMKIWRDAIEALDITKSIISTR
ncbi:hypothetical protein PNEG_01825 [Pneumocystis murina B123]|uniref:Non-structural maintenance of chromosomes element 4 n=1 Tax=Pneumocystis murina (strain B123) TaxID=1069680 RepID=M7PHY3_PNEMU|nr:hypothetical protein PNEG_01825 [Pneumocystis murina B123]EMR10074.1 hypothetical protein PNEG_01825 [Pneumocystis murina B123]